MLLTVAENKHSDSGDETELMRRIGTGDEEALGELYDLYKNILYGIILSVVKKREEAETILVRDVFLRVWRESDSFDIEQGNVHNWLVTLAREGAIRYIRPKGEDTQHRGRSRLTGDEHHDPFASTIYSNRGELIRKSLNELPENQREILKIAYYRGITCSEIADNLGVSPDTVHTEMYRGLMKLKDSLKKIIGNDE